jgi:hypothetical protein
MVIAVFLMVIGAASAMLMSRPRAVARWLWPGPTVKGPGDGYAQAFQAMVCLVVLGLVALLSGVAAYVISARVGWPAGQWCSVVPLAGSVAVLARFWLARAR